MLDGVLHRLETVESLFYSATLLLCYFATELPFYGANIHLSFEFCTQGYVKIVSDTANYFPLFVKMLLTVS